MTDETAKPPARRAGRPRRAPSPDVDPTTVDPRRVLASIAADPNAPASARVAAAKALIVTGGPGPAPTPAVEDTDPDMDRLDRRTLQITSTRRVN